MPKTAFPRDNRRKSQTRFVAELLLLGAHVVGLLSLLSLLGFVLSHRGVHVTTSEEPLGGVRLSEER